MPELTERVRIRTATSYHPNLLSTNQWEALTRFLQNGELEIDNGAAERANRDIALCRGNGGNNW
jgi:Transposase IS66 family